MFFEHADCLVGICKDVNTCSSQVLTLDLSKYNEVSQNVADNDGDGVGVDGGVGVDDVDAYDDDVDDGHRVSSGGRHGFNRQLVGYSPGVDRVVNNDIHDDGHRDVNGSGGSGGRVTKSVKIRRSSSKRKSNESGSKIYREVIVEETEADVEENDD